MTQKRQALQVANKLAGDACLKVVKSQTAWSDFLHSTPTTIYVNLVETLANVMNLGTDNSPGQRNIYSSHAYTIVDVKFVAHNGQQIVNFNPQQHLNDLDAGRSTIVLRNPHGTNVPNPHGLMNQPDTSGVFTFTLDQFIRNFGQFDSASVLR